MTCPAYWNRVIRTTFKTRYPDALIVQARRYGAPRTVLEKGDYSFTIPAVEKVEGVGIADPIRQIKKVLIREYDPTLPYGGVAILFHPLGGVSWIRPPPRE